jgi:hypothetical protein
VTHMLTASDDTLVIDALLMALTDALAEVRGVAMAMGYGQPPGHPVRAAAAEILAAAGRGASLLERTMAEALADEVPVSVPTVVEADGREKN